MRQCRRTDVSKHISIGVSREIGDEITRDRDLRIKTKEIGDRITPMIVKDPIPYQVRGELRMERSIEEIAGQIQIYNQD